MKLVAEIISNLKIKVFIISLSLFLIQGCEMKNKPIEKIKLIQSYSLKISEPSDAALAENKLWIVSDSKSTVYQTDLEGNILYKFKIDATDLEGITIFDKSFLAITIEKKREIIISDFKGNEISRVSFNIDGDKNSGLEGITYNPVNNHFYLVNEKNPVLIIETDKKFNEIKRSKVKEVKDLSGISYSEKENCLWLLSDEDQKIIKYSLKGEFLAEYKINVDQPEGIAVDDKNNLIYVLSDKEGKLFVYKIE